MKKHDKKHDIHRQFTQTKNMTYIYNLHRQKTWHIYTIYTDKKHDIHRQFTQTKNMTIYTDKKHDIHRQFTQTKNMTYIDNLHRQKTWHT